MKSKVLFTFFHSFDLDSIAERWTMAERLNGIVFVGVEMVCRTGIRTESIRTAIRTAIRTEGYEARLY